MAKERVVRSGRRTIGRFLDDDRTFYIADNKSNVKEGKVKLPAKTFHAEIVGLADTLVLIVDGTETSPLIKYWLSVHEFLAYAKEIKGQYVVPLYNFKSRRL